MRKSTTTLTVFLIFAIILSSILFIQTGNLNNKLTYTTEQLTTTEQQLNVKETELSSTKAELSDTQVKLNHSETNLQIAQKQLTTTTNQLTETKSQLSGVQTELTSARTDNARMLKQYSGLREQIMLRLGDETNCEKFITPDDPLVFAKTREIAGTYSQDIQELWRDYRQLYDWVINNIKYSYDSYLPVLPATMSGNLTWIKDFWRMPAETLKDKTGDCEDMAVLLTSLLLSCNNQGFSVWAIGLKNEDKAHLAVAFPVKGNKLTILDPAGNYYTGYQAGYLQSYDVNRSVSDWLAYWVTEIPNAKIYVAFSNTFHREFTNSEEFINWVNERPD